MAEAARWDRASMAGDDWTVSLTVQGPTGAALNVTGTWTLQLLSGPGGSVVESFTPNTTGAASGLVSFTLAAATTAGLAAKRYAWACWWTPSAGSPTQTILGGWWIVVPRGAAVGSPGGDAATVQVGTDAVTVVSVAGLSSGQIPAGTVIASSAPANGAPLIGTYQASTGEWALASTLPPSDLLGAVVGSWLYGGTQYNWLTVTQLDFANGAGSNNFSVGSAIGLFGPGVTGTGNVNVSVGGLRSLTSGNANTALGPSLAALQTGSDNFGAGGALGAMILGDNALAGGPGTMESYAPTAADLPDDPDHIVGALDTQLVAWGAGAGAAVKAGRSLTLIGDGAGNNPYSMGTGGTRIARRHVHVGTWTGLTAEMDVDDVTTLGWHALGGGTGATALGSSSVADGAYATVAGYGTNASAAGAAALFADHTGAGAVSDAEDLAVLGTALHTVQIPGTLQLKSPNGSAWNIEVSNTGVLSAVAA